MNNGSNTRSAQIPFPCSRYGDTGQTGDELAADVVIGTRHVRHLNDREAE
jgi:hypothetical protein